MRHLISSQNQAGFTIIELMVATAVFSMVIVLVTTAVLQVTNTYLRGVTTANTQETARSIMDDVAQSIQFSAGSVTSTPPAPAPSGPGNYQLFCVDGTRYSYQLNSEVASATNVLQHQAIHALVRDNAGPACASSMAQNLNSGPLSSGSVELLGSKMRLARLSVTPLANNLYKVEVAIIYGDDNVLSSNGNNPTPLGACANNGGLGIEFCATTDLITIVQRRI